MRPITEWLGARSAAAAVGMADSLGTVSVGKCADLVVVKNDPLQNIELLRQPANIEMVWKDGVMLIDRRSDDTVTDGRMKLGGLYLGSPR